MRKECYVIMIIIVAAIVTGCTRGQVEKDSTIKENITNANVENSVDHSNQLQEDEVNEVYNQKDEVNKVSSQKDEVNEIYNQNELDTFAGIDESLFLGKVREIYYGKKDTLLVKADQIYLYDTVKGNVIGSVELEQMREMKCYGYDTGYAVIGMMKQSNNSAMLGESQYDEWICILYDEKLKETSRVSISNVLNGDFVIGVSTIALSSDGKKIAVATFNKVYLYDIKTEEVSEILNFSEKGNDDLKLDNISYLSFVQNNSKLAFLGNSIQLPVREGENAVATYGVLDVNGDDITNIWNESYVADEMISYEKFMYLPEAFRKSKSQLLLYSFHDNKEQLLSFANKDEGKDGVFGSIKGEYFATAVLKDNLTVRVYDKNSKSLLIEQVITDENDIYFYRVPHIFILDNPRICIVLLGCSQEDIITKIVTFEF